MKKVSLWRIYKIYFIIGLQLLGGGYVIMPLLKKYLIEDNSYLKGAIMAVIGLVTTPFIIILLVASFLLNISDNIYVQSAFFGIRLSIIVLIFSMVADIFKSSVNSKFSRFVFLLIFILGLFSFMSPTILVILSVLISIFYYKMKEEKNA